MSLCLPVISLAKVTKVMKDSGVEALPVSDKD